MHDAQNRAARWKHVETFRSELIAQAQRRGLTREEAEDVASEAILRAGAKPDLDLATAQCWLRRVTRNLAVDAYRARLTPARASRLAHVMDPAPLEPQSAVDDQLEAAWAAQLVTRLPGRQQMVLQRKAAGASLHEIAAQLDVPYKTVESLVSRARTSMREALGTALGFIAFVAAGLRRGARAVSPGMLAAAGVVLLAVPLGPAGAGPDVENVAPAPQPVVESAAVPRFAPVTQRRPQTRSTGTNGDRRPPLRSVNQMAGAGNVGPIQHSAVETTRRDPDRTLAESVEDCLRQGLEVSPENIGCAD